MLFFNVWTVLLAAIGAFLGYHLGALPIALLGGAGGIAALVLTTRKGDHSYLNFMMGVYLLWCVLPMLMAGLYFYSGEWNQILRR